MSECRRFRGTDGHARKAAVKLKAYSNSVYYHENIEGGHSMAFLTKEVGTTKK